MSFQNFIVIMIVITAIAASRSSMPCHPIEVCFCSNDKAYCSIDSLEYNNTIFSGEAIHVNVSLVDKCNATASGWVQVSLLDGKATNLSKINDTKCNGIDYAVASLSQTQIVVLQTLCLDKENITVRVRIKECPLGFTATEVDPKCKCQPILSDYGLNCFIDNQTIQRKSRYWIGYYNASNSPLHLKYGEVTNDSLVVHEVCPFDYCNDITFIHSSDRQFNADEQCAYKRTGLLCGQCPPHLSSAIASSNCFDCSGYSISVSILLSVAFAVGGILLVAILFICNFTVTQGTLSGLIFYANIFAVNVSILLPDNKFTSLNYFAIIFLSWLNLDPGIDICFYNGLTEYHKIWGHFIFPVYLWTIAGLIVFLCGRYIWVARLVGRNAVPVLATILLLSYAKINQGIIKSLSYTVMEFHTSNESFPVRVWLLDSNIEYLSGKHIALFIAAIIFGILSLSYTLLLLFIRPIQKNSHRKCLRWVNKLKPLIDAYSCPHIIEEQKQFWNGFLLLSRLLLFIISAGLDNHRGFHLLMISTFCLLLLTVAWSLGGIYKRWQHNLLSSSMILNLGLLSSALMYFQLKKLHHVAVVCSFVSILKVVVVFIGITLFHSYKVLKSVDAYQVTLSKCTERCINTVVMRKRTRGYDRLVNTDCSSTSEDTEHVDCKQFVRDHSEFDYREPQLAQLD